jgi:hypothetical protein
VGGALGAAGGALGLYNGLKQGGALGYTNAALSAANMASGIGTLAGGTAAGGLGALASIGAYAGPIGLALAPILYGMQSKPVQVSGQWLNKATSGLKQGLNSKDSGTQANTAMQLASMLDNSSLKGNPQLEALAAQYGIKPISQMGLKSFGGPRTTGRNQF